MNILRENKIKVSVYLPILLIVIFLITTRQVQAAGQLICWEANDGTGDEICQVSGGYYRNNDYGGLDLGFSRIRDDSAVTGGSNYLQIQHDKVAHGDTGCNKPIPPSRQEHWANFTVVKNGRNIFTEAKGSAFSDAVIKSVEFNYSIDIAARHNKYDAPPCTTRYSGGVVFKNYDNQTAFFGCPVWGKSTLCPNFNKNENGKTGSENWGYGQANLNWSANDTGQHSLTFFTAVTTYSEYIYFYNIRFRIRRSNRLPVCSSVAAIPSTINPSDLAHIKVTASDVDKQDVFATHWNATCGRFPKVKSITVRALGDIGLGVWPQMELWTDGYKLKTFTVNSASWRNYTKNLSAPRSLKNLAVTFTNDGGWPTEDRNLYIDKIILGLNDGSTETLEAEIRSETIIDRAIWGSSYFDGRLIRFYDVINKNGASGRKLGWDSSLRFPQIWKAPNTGGSCKISTKVTSGTDTVSCADTTIVVNLPPTPTTVPTPTPTTVPPTPIPTSVPTPVPTTPVTLIPTPTPGTTAIPTPIPTATSVPAPTGPPFPGPGLLGYFTTQNGDVHSSQKIRDTELPIGEFLADYMVSTTDSLGYSDFGNGQASKNDWRLGDYSISNSSDKIWPIFKNGFYQFFTRQFPAGSNLKIKTITSESGIDTNATDAQVYYVHGSLNITADLQFSSPQAAVVVVIENNLIISPNVTRLDGLFLVDGQIETGNSNSNVFTNYGGMAVSKSGKFLLQRKAPSSPGETFIANPKYFVLLNNLLGEKTITFAELAP